jgi:hypothetical protein
MQLASEIVGWTGTTLLVIAYFSVSFRGRPPSTTFQVLNGLGAIALIINGAVHGAWPSVGLNVLWLAVAIVALLAPVVRRRAAMAADEPEAGRADAPAADPDGDRG